MNPQATTQDIFRIVWDYKNNAKNTVNQIRPVPLKALMVKANFRPSLNGLDLSTLEVLRNYVDFTGITMRDVTLMGHYEHCRFPDKDLFSHVKGNPTFRNCTSKQKLPPQGPPQEQQGLLRFLGKSRIPKVHAEVRVMRRGPY